MSPSQYISSNFVLIVDRVRQPAVAVVMLQYNNICYSQRLRYNISFVLYSRNRITSDRSLCCTRLSVYFFLKSIHPMRASCGPNKTMGYTYDIGKSATNNYYSNTAVVVFIFLYQKIMLLCSVRYRRLAFIGFLCTVVIIAYLGDRLMSVYKT